MTRVKSRSSLIFMLIMLSLLFISMQAILFYIHYSMGSLLDSLATSPLAHSLYRPFRITVWLPIFIFIMWQLCAYLFLVMWAWFCAQQIGKLLRLQYTGTYLLGIFLWCLSSVALMGLNQFYYPASFFATLFLLPPIVVLISVFICVYASGLAFILLFLTRRHFKVGIMLLSIIVLIVSDEIYQQFFFTVPSAYLARQPNIFIIGLDSLRPDFINSKLTPALSEFMEHATVYTQAYTPLARTFPSWVSVFTGLYPKHNAARMNLADRTPILNATMLGDQLKRAGYFTIYATDEPRFTDIDKAYGFDSVIGPKGHAVEFIIGALSDFPIINLLSNLAIGQFIFPYNYGNRAMDIAYRSNNFLQLVKQGLQKRPLQQPIFFSIHFCLSHWPFTYARDERNDRELLVTRYERSIVAVDKQFNHFLALLKDSGLLNNSLVIVLSDHGVTLGLPHDRLLEKKHYVGLPSYLSFISAYKLNAKDQFTINTSYGQGTDVLSLKQNHVLLSIKNYAANTAPKKINTLVSTIDIVPTINDYLQLPKSASTDGVSLFSPLPERAFFLENADTIADIETDKIFLAKLVKHMIHAYEYDVKTGNIYINPIANASIIKNKQRAVILGDWMLAHYPAATKYVLKPNAQHKLVMQPVVMPAYYIVLNLQTHQWTIGITDHFAQTAPLESLKRALDDFYGNEIL